MTDQEKRLKFAERVWEVANRTGYNSAPKIADILLKEQYGRVCIVAKSAGIYAILRDGMVDAVKRVIRYKSQSDIRQGDFSDVSLEFRPILEKLSSERYYVPSLEEHLPIGRLIKYPPFLDEARKFHRLKGEEVLRESDALDELYLAVTAKQASLI
jgi:hypothetical protein